MILFPRQGTCLSKNMAISHQAMARQSNKKGMDPWYLVTLLIMAFPTAIGISHVKLPVPEIDQATCQVCTHGLGLHSCTTSPVHCLQRGCSSGFPVTPSTRVVLRVDALTANVCHILLARCPGLKNSFSLERAHPFRSTEPIFKHCEIVSGIGI